MPERSQVVRCRGCGGTGKVRMQPDDEWCGRCGGTSRKKVGIPPLHRLATCHICGTGTIQGI
ncbi:MAG TPA: hypothetical protein EYP71_07030 [Dehalococcoidia bacterium]|nr:hypothetical protein [Dehalococcoidia bacterium]